MKLLRNQDGQSFIEVSLTLPIVLSFIFISIFFILEKMLQISINDGIEDYFLCRHSENQNCSQELKKKLNTLPIKRVQLIENVKQQKMTLQYEIFKNRKINLSKEFSPQQERIFE